MAVAFQWMMYGSDDGNAYAIKVDADYIAMPERGWSVTAETTSPQYPRGWWPRRVIGITAEGAIREAIIASVDADLWNGTAGVFTFRDSSGAMATATIIGRRRERWLRIKLPEPLPLPPIP